MDTFNFLAYDPHAYCVVFLSLVCLVSFEFSLRFMPVTRSANQSHQVQVDLEIENTLHRLRKEARVNIMVVARQQTLKELAAPNVETNHCA